MNHWPFIIAAYGTGLLATIILVLWSWIAMRRAEREAEALTSRR